MIDDRPKDLNALSEAVIGAAMEVLNTIGAGFLEKVYERALVHELRLRGIRLSQQERFTVFYKGTSVGEYVCDILVEGTLVLELKCAERISSEHVAQGLNYMKASGKTICLILNFQRPRLEWKRLVL